MDIEAKNSVNIDHSKASGNAFDVKTLIDVISSRDEEIKKLKNELSDATAKINWFTQQIKLRKSKEFGRSSEQSEVIQFDLLPETLEEEVEEPEAAEEIISSPTKKTKSKGRRIDTSKLLRERVVHDIAEEAKCCKGCQTELVKIGEEVSEQLELIPGVIKVVEHVRIKYACRPCEKITTAQKPAAPVPKCLAGASLLTEVILGKYERHIPMYRQSKILLSQGIDIPDNTLVNWALSVYEVMTPIEKVFWEQPKITRVMQADDTGVKMLQTNKKGFMWCYRGCDPGNTYVLFAYNDSRASRVPLEHLKDFNEGILQTDGYSGFNELRLNPKIIGVGCFAHCRRKFVDVIKVSGTTTGKAHEALKIIGQLYAIEKAAATLSHAERYALRQKEAKPIIESFHNWLKISAEKVGTKSKLSQAINYALNQWKYLSAYVDHGEVEIDNNWVENEIRPFALGRKNWMFVGNKRGADAAALFYSLIQTCKLNKIEPRKYFNYVLNHVHEMRLGTMNPKDLLPQTIDKTKL